MLPGITSPAVTADFLASRFAGWGYRVSVPDIRGRGESERAGPGRAPYPTSKKSFLDQLRQAQLGTTAEEVRRFYPNWPEREMRLRAEALASCDETAVLETHDGFEREDFFADWARLTAPVALVRGERSPVVPPEGAAELSRARPDIDMVTVAAAGHMVPWDNLAGFLRALARYLPGRDTRRPA